ncbi:MAG: nickel pincer cofactor biosynthesis protein LarC [Oscillospiraceae bacterium]|nr:nickel pincer cofactor biosynthesis protein LarC [Oscillospiraceae bacterium]
MKTLYFDCSMGAAGDMLTAALLELLPDKAGFVARLNALGIPGVKYAAEPAVKCGITGTHMRVAVDGAEELAHTHGHHHHDAPPHPSASPTASPQGEGFAGVGEPQHTHEHHHHTGMHGIAHLVKDHLALPESVREDVLAVYRLIAQAESKVHGVPVEEIHFHEVGSLDAVADVAAVCLLMHEIAPDQVLASPIHLGSGQVRCAHGIMPVPAPATAELLKDVPIYSGEIQGELCTPTGAALLRYYVNKFGPMPTMRTTAVGYGMGTKDFPAANCVRALWGETAEQETDEISELRCNLDDMTGEAVAFAMERLLEAGALDVWTVPIGMKKSRPGVMLCVLCKQEDRAAMTGLLFRHTTTLGVRESAMRRAVLERRTETVETEFGPLRRKIATGYGVRQEKYEYEDLARVAREQGLSIDAVREAVLADKQCFLRSES